MSISLSISKFNELSAEDKRRAIEEGERKITGTAIFLSKPSIKTKLEAVDSLIVDSAIKIFSYLNSSDLITCCLVSKEWNEFVKEDREKENMLWNAIIYREHAFGKEKWAKYYGDVGIEPPLPKNIYEILKSPCQASPGKIVLETHMLALVPEKINERFLTLDNLGELVRAPKQGHKTEYFLLNENVNHHRNESIDKSHWVLMTRNILEGSRAKSYAEQVEMVVQLSKKAKTDYQVPKALEAAVCIFTKFVETGTRLFRSNSFLWTYTRCQEKNVDLQLCVGGFGAHGLEVVHSRSENVSLNTKGIAALRKL